MHPNFGMWDGESMKILIALMYVVAAVFPYLGARSLWKQASRDSRVIREAKGTANGEGVSYDEVQAAMSVLVPGIKEGGDSSGRDLWLIGGGLAFGALASILSLFM
ncbi:hypothetical protein [Leucobacter salsicius]|uniref:hypothetical protein n=1 Tax=Leucobacter salsicius TaxID=664638 RepID=UPI000346AD59|nr:hypothetical protein [Leucobacter salsicius]